MLLSCRNNRSRVSFIVLIGHHLLPSQLPYYYYYEIRCTVHFLTDTTGIALLALYCSALVTCNNGCRSFVILSLDEVERNASYSYPGVSERSINYFLSKEQNNGKSKKITKNIIRRSTSIIDGQCIHDSFLELLTSNNYFLKGNN